MTIEFRIIAALAALVALIAAGIGIHVHGVSQGKKIERAEWQDKEIQRQQAQNKLLIRHAEDMARTQLENDTKNRKVSDDYENRMAVLRQGRDSARATRDADPDGGLRISAAVCNPVAAGTETAGTSKRDEAAPGTISLPVTLENDLWHLVDDADTAHDEITEQARALQNWIKTHGFYGEPDPEGNR
jgi:TolA-binding protein